MYQEIGWKTEQLLKSSDEDEQVARDEAVADFIRDYNDLVRIVDAFVKLSNKLPNY